MKRLKKLKLLNFILVIAVMVGMFPAIFANASSGVTIQTTLVDNSIQKGSKKTFDVIARNASGSKISSAVTFNGENVAPNWDDENKTSYTLEFTQEGNNEVIVTAGGESVKYNITYQKAQEGEIIGYTTWTIEALSIGQGFMVEPIKVPIYEGENAAQTLDKILNERGYNYKYTGSLESGFYLSCIELGEQSSVPEYVDDTVPQRLKDCLEGNGLYLDSGWCEGENTLGEFDYTFMSGWMYAINGVFPNVGFSGAYLSDGDVVRVQFTMSYGYDIGGGYAMGGVSTDFYPVAQKDRLYQVLAEINSSDEKAELLKDTAIKSAYDNAKSKAEDLLASQEDVDSAQIKLTSALLKKSNVDNVISLINSIGIVTLESEGKITKALQAYNALPEDKKVDVTNYSILTEAEAKLQELKSVPEDKPTVSETKPDNDVDIKPDETPLAENPKTQGNALPYEIIMIASAGMLFVIASCKKKSKSK